jgi:hypothetical protein
MPNDIDQSLRFGSNSEPKSCLTSSAVALVAERKRFGLTGQGGLV